MADGFDGSAWVVLDVEPESDPVGDPPFAPTVLPVLSVAAALAEVVVKVPVPTLAVSPGASAAVVPDTKAAPLAFTTALRFEPAAAPADPLLAAPELPSDPAPAEEGSKTNEPGMETPLPDTPVAPRTFEAVPVGFAIPPGLFTVPPGVAGSELPPDPPPLPFEPPLLPLPVFELPPLLLPSFGLPPLFPGELLPLLPEELPPPPEEGFPVLGEVGLEAGVVGVGVGAGACVGVVLVVRAVGVVLVVFVLVSGCVPSMSGVRRGASGFSKGSRIGMEGIGKGKLMRARSSSSPTRLCRCCIVLRAVTAACMSGIAGARGALSC